MATTGTETVRNIVTDALRKAQFVGIAAAPSASQADMARRELNRMLKSWQNKGYNLWTKTSGSHTLITGRVQTLDPVRPLRILSMRYKSGGVEMPMLQMTRDEYDELPIKTTSGTPTQFYYDRQREAARLYIWPSLVSVNGETLEYTYEREMEDVADLDDAIDVPGEWWDAVVYNLACRVMETAGLQTATSQALYGRASAELQAALAFDREDSVFIGNDNYAYGYN